MTHATIGARRNLTPSSPEQFCRFVRSALQLRKASLRLGEQPRRPLMCLYEVVEGRRPLGQNGDRLLELGQDLVESALAQVAVAATRPRMPLTNRPASSPEKVLASSIDSLMAAFVGTFLSIAISYTAILRMTRSTFAICSSFQCSDASVRIASSSSRCAITPPTSWPAKLMISSLAPFSDPW